MLTCLSDWHSSSLCYDCLNICNDLSLITYISDINYLVMDYLITNGYPAAAKKFAVEANIQLQTDLDSVQERVEIRTAIHSGNIQAAVEKINELNPQVRHCLPSLLSFHSPILCYDYTKFHAPLLSNPPGSCGKTNIFSPQYEQRRRNHNLCLVSRYCSARSLT